MSETFWDAVALVGILILSVAIVGVFFVGGSFAVVALATEGVLLGLAGIALVLVATTAVVFGGMTFLGMCSKKSVAARYGR